MPPKPKLNVQSFPRPPFLEKTPRHLQVKWRGHTIADTKDAYWVLETYHPPTYYIPKSALSFPLKQTTKSTFCEWKGWATYWSISLPSSSSSNEKEKEVEIKDRIWSYEAPTKPYSAIRGYVSFYVGPWDCFVDGEEVRPQPGDFYGGWTTSELEGLIKGEGAPRWL
ncbi:DUF427-domain-containing protein [Hyaloscypha hepaticicola]|uniref:DUF427-domain-containing protein n=1 Tax=Hyaloscypha hepaticicola TaxID=2082293 RepID=A0A2J6PJB2_9HELO|nr:DUF427-domain-containing protein [Hyaloscypha hepaticicola]